MMKIYITDLEAYNNGHLVGNWYELPMNEDLLAEAIENELQRGRDICGDEHHHEEYFITDYECEYMKIDEYDSISKLNEIAEQVEALDDTDKKKLSYLMEQVGYDFAGAISNLEDCDIYEDVNMKQLAEQFIDEGLFGEIPDRLSYYIDYDAVARDLEMDYNEYNGDIYRAS